MHCGQHTECHLALQAASNLVVWQSNQHRLMQDFVLQSPEKKGVFWSQRHPLLPLPVSEWDLSAEAETIKAAFRAHSDTEEPEKRSRFLPTPNLCCPWEIWWRLTCWMRDWASLERLAGQRTSSFTMLSKISSSSSPGKGHWKEIINVKWKSSIDKLRP